MFVGGGAAIVIVSVLFVTPRAVEADATEPARRRLRRTGPARPVGVVGLLALAFLIWCGLAGSQALAENIVTMFWVIASIEVPLTCGLIGDWTQPVNPFAVLAKFADRPALRARLLDGPETYSKVVSCDSIVRWRWLVKRW